MDKLTKEEMFIFGKLNHVNHGVENSLGNCWADLYLFIKLNVFWRCAAHKVFNNTTYRTGEC